MSIDRYRTLVGGSEASLREKASRFIAFAFPIADEEAFRQHCAAIAKDHHACRHVCSAWVLGEDGGRFRVDDAGEPAGTAGGPILRQLQGARLTHAAIVVVRYFGGTLLGRGGLVRAYAEAAQNALEKNVMIERVLRTSLRVTCTYALVEAIKSDVITCEGELLSASYSHQCALHVAIARGALYTFCHRWTIAGAMITIDQVK